MEYAIFTLKTDTFFLKQPINANLFFKEYDLWGESRQLQTDIKP